MTPTQFDLIISILFLLIAALGWHRGFFKTILGPLAFTLALMITAFLYAEKANILIIVISIVIGPLFFRIALGIGFMFWKKLIIKDKPPSFFSRTLGLIITSIWFGSFIVTGTIASTMIKPPIDKIAQLQSTIKQSASYNIFQNIIGAIFPQYDQYWTNTVQLIENKKVDNINEDSKHYKNIVGNQTFQSIIEDQQTLDDIQNKNYKNLLQNKKIQALLHDGELVKEILALTQERLRTEQKQTKP